MSIINHGITKHYAGSQVSDCCPIGYLFWQAPPHREESKGQTFIFSEHGHMVYQIEKG